jgi:hypothetical protein
MAEVVVGFLSVSACELVWVDLSSNPVDTNCEVMVGNGCISGLYSPKWLGEAVNCSRWVEDYFCAIEAEAQPVKRVMSAVANVDTNFTELSLENWVTGFSLHVVGGLVEVSYSWDVTLLLLSEDVSVVIDDYGCVVESLFALLPL